MIITHVKYWKSILWSVLICILLFIPGNRLPSRQFFNIPGLDKIIHLVLFLVLEWLILYERGIKIILYHLISVLKITFFALAFAIITELIQHYLILERKGSIDDLIMDIIGIFIGVLVYDTFYRLTNRFSRLKS